MREEDGSSRRLPGLSMALIALVADRIAQAWAARRKEELGLV